MPNAKIGLKLSGFGCRKVVGQKSIKFAVNLSLKMALVTGLKVKILTSSGLKVSFKATIFFFNVLPVKQNAAVINSRHLDSASVVSILLHRCGKIQ